MPPRLYKVAEVCETAQLQPYVLRSWEKEFPGIGLQKSPEAPRLYRQSDIDQVLRIKQLVFGEGLTLAGARRRIDALAPQGPSADEVAEVIEAVSADVRKRIGHVREGLRSLLQLLNGGSPARASRASAQRGKSATRTATVVSTRRTSTARRPSATKRKRVTA